MTDSRPTDEAVEAVADLQRAIRETVVLDVDEAAARLAGDKDGAEAKGYKIHFYEAIARHCTYQAMQLRDDE